MPTTASSRTNWCLRFPQMTDEEEAVVEDFDFDELELGDDDLLLDDDF